MAVIRSWMLLSSRPVRVSRRSTGMPSARLAVIFSIRCSPPEQGRLEREPFGFGEQVRDGGHGRGELPPAGQRGQLDDGAGAARACGWDYRHFSASRKGSKIGIGTMAASLAVWSSGSP